MDDAQLLDAEEDEHREENVEKLHRQEQQPERQPRTGALGRERDSVMPDEQLSAPPGKNTAVLDFSRRHEAEVFPDARRLARLARGSP